MEKKLINLSLLIRKYPLSKKLVNLSLLGDNYKLSKKTEKNLNIYLKNKDKTSKDQENDKKLKETPFGVFM